MLRVRLLGGLSLELDGEHLAPPSAAAARSMLAWLALNPGPHPRAELAVRFWPDVLDESARQSLRNALWALRRSLGPAGELVRAGGDSIALSDEVEVDARALEAALVRGDADEAARLADPGELLRGFDSDWALAARDEHRERLGGLFAQRAAEAEDPGAAVEWARRRARLDPLSEEAARALMRRLHEAGDGSAALAVYERFAERLRRELRVAPSAPTRELAAQLRAASEAPAPPAAVPGSVPETPAREEHAALPRPLELTGRSAELGVLAGQWAAARGGSGGVVVLEGEAGIGKTRLAAELLSRVAAEGAATGAGAGVELEAAAPLTPWAELLDSLLDNADELAGRSWRADLARLIPRLGATAASDGSDGSELDRVRLHEAVVESLREVAGHRPALLVLEDAHLADDASLALLVHVGRRISSLPVLVLVTRRPTPNDGLDAAERHLAAAGAVGVRLPLGPLRDADTGELVRRSADALPESEVQRAVAAADGNPLLAVETARALAAGHTGAAPSLVTVVRSLLPGLSGEGRGLVDLLATAGRTLDPAEVDALPLDEPALAASEGVACGLLEAADGPLGFRHALLREAAYADLEPPRRRRLHERMADALLQADSRRPAEVARHLRLAGRDGRAVEHLADAARAARDVAALTEARAYVEEALDIEPEDPDLWLLLAHIQALRGRREEMLDASDRGLVLLPTGDAARRGVALAERGILLSSALCWPAEALEDFRAAYPLLEGRQELRGPLGRLCAASAWAEAVAGDPARVEALLAEAEELMPFDELGAIGIHIVSARVNALVRQDRAHEALALADQLEQALSHERWAPRLGDTAWLELSSVAAYVGEHERALALVERSLEASGDLLSKRIEGLAALAYVQVRLGRADEAVAAAQEMVEAADELGDAELPALARHDLGSVIPEEEAHRLPDQQAAVRASLERLATVAPPARG